MTIWRDNRDLAAAYCFAGGSDRWITLPEVGAFRFGTEPGPVEGFVSSRVPDPCVLDRYHRVVLPIVHQAFGHEVLHASAVSTPRGVVALCGTSGVGKSTLAGAMGRRGHQVVADDAVVLSFHREEIALTALPFELRLTARSSQILGNLQSQLADADTSTAARKIRAFVLVDRSTARGQESAVEPIPPPVAFNALLTHGLCFDIHDRSRRRRLVENYLRLAAEVPAYHLSVRSGLRHLEDALDELEGTWR